MHIFFIKFKIISKFTMQIYNKFYVCIIKLKKFKFCYWFGVTFFC